MKIIIFLMLILGAACNNSPLNNPNAITEDPTPFQTIDPTIAEEFMELVNDHRSGLGLRPLLVNEDLSHMVEQHCQDMANGSVAFGHSGFSARCSEARSFLGGGNWCGENVAKGQKSAQAAFTSWMNSPGHRANIESSRATHTGFGFSQSTSGVKYWTQIFLEL